MSIEKQGFQCKHALQTGCLTAARGLAMIHRARLGGARRASRARSRGARRTTCTDTTTARRSSSAAGRGEARNRSTRSRRGKRATEDAASERTAGPCARSSSSERATSRRRNQRRTQVTDDDSLATGTRRSARARVDVLAQLAGAVTRLEDVVGGVRGDQGGAVAREDAGVGARVATQPRSVGTMLTPETGEEEGQLGLLGVGRQADEGTRDIGFELRGVLDVRNATGDAGESEFTAWGLEAGDLGADLLDGGKAQAVLLLQALEVGVAGGGAAGEAGDEALVDLDRGVEALDEDLEVPGELHDGVIAGANGGRTLVLGRRGGDPDEEQAGEGRKEAHFARIFSFFVQRMDSLKRLVSVW
jgi:hypothetical protein